MRKPFALETLVAADPRRRDGPRRAADELTPSTWEPWQGRRPDRDRLGQRARHASQVPGVMCGPMDPQRLRASARGGGRRTRHRRRGDARAARPAVPRRSAFAHVDTHRHLRTGFPEVVLGEGKTPEQIAAILDRARQGAGCAPCSRRACRAEAARGRPRRVPGARYLPVPRAIVVGDDARRPIAGAASIAVVSAGTADIPVAEEAALTAELAGNRVERVFDVGVAGIHRLLAHRAIDRARPRSSSSWPAWRARCRAWSAGLFARPVIAVPTSVGYGASFGGIAALLAHAELVRGGRRGGEHRQRLRRRPAGGDAQPEARHVEACRARRACTCTSSRPRASRATWRWPRWSTPACRPRSSPAPSTRWACAGCASRFGRRRRGAFVGRSFDVTLARPGATGARHEATARPRTPPRAHRTTVTITTTTTRTTMHATLHAHDHRDYAEVKRLLARARLDADARALAGDIFARIAEVEAELHGMRVDRVAFHEVGAYDSIADVVGVAAAIACLAPASIGSLPPVVGTGRVRTAHGPVPVPAPATAALLRGIPILSRGRRRADHAHGRRHPRGGRRPFGPLPPMRVARRSATAPARASSPIAPTCCA